MNGSSPADIFLSCDWGTTTFRLHLVDVHSEQSLAALNTSDGINAVHQAWQVSDAVNHREEFFLNRVQVQLTKLAAASGRSLDGVPMVMSGMVTSSIGLREIPHRPMPFALDGSDLRVERCEFQSGGPGSVLLVSGVRTGNDFMRGEEIQIVGACARGAERGALFILPGTHSKHVTVEGGQAVGVRTFMTGEFFELLARRSILANSVEEAMAADQSGVDAAFLEGVKAGVTGNLLHTSFGVRVAEVSGQRDRSAGYHYLSGLVIGTELKEFQPDAQKPIVVVGTPILTSRYTLAMRALGHTGTINPVDAGLAVIAGHQQVARLAGLIR